jgi:hypothetical protein
MKPKKIIEQTIPCEKQNHSLQTHVHDTKASNISTEKQLKSRSSSDNIIQRTNSSSYGLKRPVSQTQLIDILDDNTVFTGKIWQLKKIKNTLVPKNEKGCKCKLNKNGMYCSVHCGCKGGCNVKCACHKNNSIRKCCATQNAELKNAQCLKILNIDKQMSVLHSKSRGK